MTQLIRLIGLLRGYLPTVCIAVFFQLLTALFTLVSIPLVIPFFQILFGTSPSSYRPPSNAWDIEASLNYGFSRLIAISDRPTALIFVCVLVLIVFFLRNLFRFLASYFSIPAINGVVRDLRSKIFVAYTKMSIQKRSDEKKGGLLSLISSDLAEVEHGILKAMELLFKTPFIVLGAVLFMLWLNTQLAIVALGLIVFTLVVIGTLSHSLKKPSAQAQKTLADIHVVSEEYLNGKKLIDGHNASPYFTGLFTSFNQEHYKISNRILRKRDLASPLTEILGVLTVVILLWFGAQLVFDQQLNPPTFFAFILAFYHIIDPAKRFSRELANVHKGLAALDRIDRFTIQSEQTEVRLKKDLTVRSFKSSIVFKDVSFAYGDGTEKVLKNLNLEIKVGEKIGITGLSGAGKTSLIDLLLRFYPNHHGQILLDDLDIGQYNLGSYRQLYGLVTQDPVIFHTTIKQNILLDRQFDQESFDRALAQAHVDFLKDSKSIERDRELGDMGLKLSGGERQRVSIARAIYGRPDILVLDEPTSSLDMDSADRVYRALLTAMKDRTTILVSHNLDLLQRMDRILVLDDGCIVQDGKWEDLIKSPGVFSRLSQIKNKNQSRDILKSPK